MLTRHFEYRVVARTVLQRRALPALIFAGAVCAAAPSAFAQASAPAGDAPAQAREVRAWLMRIHDAASHRNFQGTFVVSGGGAVS